MNEEQIDRLVATLSRAGVVWLSDGEYKRIRKVIPPIENEPSRCALLEGGGYLALWNVDPEDLMICRPLFGPHLAEC